MVKFEWMITPWSDCSQSCVNHTAPSTIGYKVREMFKVIWLSVYLLNPEDGHN